MMVCLEGRKYQEVADLLGISVNTVRTQMGRAFQFLRVALDKRRFSMFLLIVLEVVFEGPGVGLGFLYFLFVLFLRRGMFFATGMS